MRYFNKFTNYRCEFYPCHEYSGTLNCLFCYCPLYHMEGCGGIFTLLENGKKDCSKCILPHACYDYVISKLKEDE